MQTTANARFDTTRADVCHGICRSCSKRTFLWLAGRICEKCIKRAISVADAEAELNFVNTMLAELEELDDGGT